MLDRVDVHCIWVSDKVLSLLPETLPDIPGGEIPGGEIPARGVFCDNAMDIVLEYYPKPSKARKTAFVKTAMIELNKLGIVGMHDAGVVPRDLDLYGELSTDEDWSVRVYAMIECDVRNTFCPDAFKKLSTPNGKFHVQGVKLFGGTQIYLVKGIVLILNRRGAWQLGQCHDRTLQRQAKFIGFTSGQCDNIVQGHARMGNGGFSGQYSRHW